MRILVIHDGVLIKAWIVDQPVESAEEHIKNGYSGLLSAWESGGLTAAELEVAPEDEFRADLYEVADGAVRKKA